ncbi:MAG: NHL repeat-containing protein, partial [Candidatus Dormiibacterota bacterium]
MEVLHHKSMRITLVCLLFVFLLGFMPHDFAFSNGQAASLVIGESDFTSSGAATTSTGLNAPQGLAFDSSGNLWVADLNNNRILEYRTPLSTGEAASLVIGQSSFTTNALATTSTGLNAPQGLAFDSSGNLWVVDTSNNRVLEYTTPLSTGEAASLVIGQSSFTTNALATTSTGLSFPFALAFDSSGNLWVADEENNRVLEYTTPLSTGEAASLVIGQPSFTTSNFPISSTGLNGPNAIAFDSSGNLWISDFRHDRVLEYSTPFSTHEAASLVIGQSSFTACVRCFTSIGGVTTSTGMNSPTGLAFDQGHNLWVMDGGNNRVLEYTTPFSTFEAASLVIGQNTFTGNSTGTSSTTLGAPQGLAFDSGHNLWVADYGNYRVLRYGSSPPSTTTATSSTPSTKTSTTSSVTTSSFSITSTSTSASTNTLGSASATSTSKGGGVPEFPFQLAIVAVFTIALVGVTLVVRRHSF